MKKTLLFLFCLTVTVATAADFLVGTLGHYFWDELPIEESQRIMIQGGHNSFRTEASWYRCEPKPGVWKIYQREIDALDAAKRNGLTPLVLLAGTSKKINDNFPYGEYMPPFLEYIDNTTKQLKGKAPLIQIWNEWDGGHMMSVGRGKINTSANYVELLKQAYPIVKRNCPDAIVMSNSFSTGEKALYEAFAAGMQDYCDAYSIHIYDWNWGTPEAMYPGMVRREQMSAKYHNGVPLPFYITEFGWLTHEKCVSEATQADYLARFLLLARTIKSCKGVYQYNFQDRGEDWRNKEMFWGQHYRDLTPKESNFAFRSVANLIKNAEFVRRIDVNDPDVWILLFKKDDGSLSLAAWTVRTDVRQQIVLNKKGGPCGTIQFERCGSPIVNREWGFLDQCCGFKQPNVFRPFNAEQFSFHVRTRPVLIHNLPKTVVVESTRAVYNPQTRDFVPVIPAAFKEIQPGGTDIMLAGESAWRQLGTHVYAGANDLSCKATVRYDSENLYIDFDVTDDIFAPVKTDDRNWEGDSIQLSFSRLERGRPYTTDYTDYMLSCVNGKPSLLFRTNKQMSYAHNGTQAKFTFKRAPNNHYIYSFFVPFVELGVDYYTLATGMTPLGFTYIVNDNDNKGRKGWLAWGDGIGGTRDMAMYGWLYFGQVKENGMEIGFPTAQKNWSAYGDKAAVSFSADTYAGVPCGKLTLIKTDGNTGYVAIRRALPQPISNFKEMRVSLLNSPIKEMAVRYVDATGQIFQYRYAIKQTDQPQIVSCRFDNHNWATSHNNMSIWGGAKDKVWHDPMQGVEILLQAGSLVNADPKAASLTWHIGTIRILTKDDVK